MSSNVLFDAPGPRARRRHAILSVLGAALVVGLVYLVVRKLGDAGQLEVEQWKPFVVDRSVWRDYLVPGLLGTFKAAVISIAQAAVFGLLLWSGRLAGAAAIRWVRRRIV